MSQIDTEVQDTLLVNVETRSVSNGTKTIWELVTEDGTKWATFKADIGNAGMALTGKRVNMKVSIKKNGDFTNYYVNHVILTPGQAVTPVGQAIEQAAAAQAAQPVVSFDQFKSDEAEKTAAKNESIHRQVAAKVAATLTGEQDGPADFWANVESILNFFRTGVIPGTKPIEATYIQTGTTANASTTEVTTTATLPTFTGQGDPGSELPPRDDDDVPF